MAISQTLVGSVLDGGWRVIQEVVPGPTATGGRNSKCFLVEQESGQIGFLKTIDYEPAFLSPDPAPLLNAMTESFLLERRLLDECTGMSRIVKAIAYGTTKLGNSPFPIQYIIFERADSDVRRQLQLKALADFDHAWALRTLHNMAVGLQQLHKKGIAHQDLKPSNVLQFPNGTKIADLGRASSTDLRAPHDDYRVAGDKGYAPPELLYGEVDADWRRRRLACDLYLLGSLAVSLYLGVPMTAAILAKVAPDHHWRTWGDGYRPVLTHIRGAFEQVVHELSARVPAAARDRLVQCVRDLCDPDPRIRGTKSDRSRGNPYSLEQFVSGFNLLARKAELGWLK